jgi:hypothetical protein
LRSHLYANLSIIQNGTFQYVPIQTVLVGINAPLIESNGTVLNNRIGRELGHDAHRAAEDPTIEHVDLKSSYKRNPESAVQYNAIQDPCVVARAGIDSESCIIHAAILDPEVAALECTNALKACVDDAGLYFDIGRVTNPQTDSEFLRSGPEEASSDNKMLMLHGIDADAIVCTMDLKAFNHIRAQS